MVALLLTLPSPTPLAVLVLGRVGADGFTRLLVRRACLSARSYGGKLRSGMRESLQRCTLSSLPAHLGFHWLTDPSYRGGESVSAYPVGNHGYQPS